MTTGAIAGVPRSAGSRRTLLALAAPSEARAALRVWRAPEILADRAWELHRLTDRLDLVVTGISKANAAGAVARVLAPREHAAVLSLGVAGALPDSGLNIADVVLSESSVFADEGLQVPEGFRDCAAVGFPLGLRGGAAAPMNGELLEALRPLADAAGPIATVSTCSGTDGRAKAIRERTGALAEAMEGAAVGLVAERVAVPFGEVRVISNTTGDRDQQVWDLPRALDALSRLIGRL